MESNMKNYSEFNLTNTTLEIDDDDMHRRLLKKICDYSTVTVVVTIMLSMGADISLKQIWSHVRMPVGVVIGMSCQFFVIPLIGYGMTKALHLQDAYAVGTLLITCCPGGALSNIFTYYMDGDVSLSITMTSLSTVLALGFMPLNFWIYGRFIETSLIIPYKQIATSLVAISSPVAVGMLLRRKYQKFAHYLTKCGSICSILFIVAIVVTQNFAYPTVLISLDWKIVIAVTTIPIIGIIIGYIVSWATCQNLPVRKTIAIESGVQNVALAMAVIALSAFPFEVQGQLMLIPMLYGIYMTAICVIICSAYSLWKRFTKKNKTIYEQKTCEGSLN